MGYVKLISLLVISTILTIIKSDEECPAIYQRYSTSHTVCKPPNPSCKILRSSVCEEDIRQILKLHNQYRNKLATGKETGFPPASNMLEMTWDEELATVAQHHANRCIYAHDCSDCRRVWNFGVGQNLAIENITGSSTIPSPDWELATKMWYDEVKYFSPSLIKAFVDPPKENTYAHFTQVVWANTWRIGCGYTLFQEGDNLIKLYTCNYGPAGNFRGQSLYEKGAACSNCPLNTFCGKALGTYEGLCKVFELPPKKIELQNYIFFCDFNYEADCERLEVGNWLTYTTLSGTYIGTVVKGGESASLSFENSFKPHGKEFCFVISYRNGPNVAGEKAAGSPKETFTILSPQSEIKQDLKTFEDEYRQQFSQFEMHLSWPMETKYEVSFSVPEGATDQFFEIEKLYAADGPCSPKK